MRIEVADDFSQRAPSSPIIKMKIKFDPTKLTLLLTFSEIRINKLLRNIAAQKKIIPKKEFHITVIGSRTGDEILEKIGSLSKEEKNKILSSIEKLAKDISWGIKTKEVYFYIKKEYNDPDDEDPTNLIHEIREAIIQPVVLKGVNECYRKLNSIIQIKFETPFPYFSIFTNSTRLNKVTLGIGIYSKKDFKSINPQRIKLSV